MNWLCSLLSGGLFSSHGQMSTAGRFPRDCSQMIPGHQSFLCSSFWIIKGEFNTRPLYKDEDRTLHREATGEVQHPKTGQSTKPKLSTHLKRQGRENLLEPGCRAGCGEGYLSEAVTWKERLSLFLVHGREESKGVSSHSLILCCCFLCGQIFQKPADVIHAGSPVLAESKGNGTHLAKDCQVCDIATV